MASKKPLATKSSKATTKAAPSAVKKSRAAHDDGVASFDFDGPGVASPQMSAALEAAKIAKDSATRSQPRDQSSKNIAATIDKAASEKTSGKVAKASQSVQAAQSAKSAQLVPRIFQIYYEAWQRELLDPNFVPLDNGKTSSELMEFAVFERLAKSDYVKDAQLWGAMSWRFTERTGMTGADWIKAILAQPGKDVYYCDPVARNERRCASH